MVSVESRSSVKETKNREKTEGRKCANPGIRCSEDISAKGISLCKLTFPQPMLSHKRHRLILYNISKMVLF